MIFDILYLYMKVKRQPRWLSFFATTFKFEKKRIFETYFYFVDIVHQLRLRACAIISKM